jgi:polar amino acid transport system substrate-binding protein
MKWHYAGLAALCGVSLLARADDLDEVKARKSIRIGVLKNSLPFGQIEQEDKASGYDADFATAIARRLGTKPVFVESNVNSAAAMLNQRKVDIVVASLARSADREKVMAFSRGYYVSNIKVLVPQAIATDEEKLKSRVICVTNESGIGRELGRDYPNLTVNSALNLDNALAKISSGDCDALAGEEGTLRYYQSKLPKMVLSEYSLMLMNYGIGLRHDNGKLVTAVNDALADIERSGEAERIFSRWFTGPHFANFFRSFHID